MNVGMSKLSAGTVFLGTLRTTVVQIESFRVDDIGGIVDLIV